MEINLLARYPKMNRDIYNRSGKKTEADRALARQFGKEFFDGERSHGYGGYHYHPRFWQGVVQDFQRHYGLTASSTILDVGCAKGFLLYDFMQLIPGISVRGIDISSYAIETAPPEVKPFVQVADARTLPFADHSFDLVISLNTVHNFEGEELVHSLREIQRVSRGKSFVFVDGYRTEEEKEQLFHWNLTAKSILHADQWKEVFKKAQYTGDYYWFMP